MQEKDFNNTWIGWGYNYFSHLRFAKNLLKATSLPQTITQVGMYTASPIAKTFENETITQLTQYGVIGVGLVLNPYVTIPMVTINYFGDKILEYKWSSMTDEQRESSWGKEIHAAMMVAKQEIAIKAGDIAEKYGKEQQSNKSQSEKNEASKTNAQSEQKPDSQTQPESNIKNEPKTDANKPKPSEVESKNNWIDTKGQAFDAETNKKVDDLLQRGYKPQVPKTRNGEYLDTHQKITPQRAKELVKAGQTVEFKNSNAKGSAKKIWLTRENPYTMSEASRTADHLYNQLYKPQIPKTDKDGNLLGGHKKITLAEAKGILAKGGTVEFKDGFYKQKTWVTGEKPSNQKTTPGVTGTVRPESLAAQTKINQQVDNLIQRGYQPQVPKKWDGVYKDTYQKITPDKAKELLGNGRTVEFKNPNVKGTDRKIWLTTEDPTFSPAYKTAEALTMQGYQPQVPKTDANGNPLRGHRELSITEAQELLAKGKPVEFKHWNNNKPNRKIWITGVRPLATPPKELKQKPEMKPNQLPAQCILPSRYQDKPKENPLIIQNPPEQNPNERRGNQPIRIQNQPEQNLRINRLQENNFGIGKVFVGQEHAVDREELNQEEDIRNDDSQSENEAEINALPIDDEAEQGNFQIMVMEEQEAIEVVQPDQNEYVAIIQDETSSDEWISENEAVEEIQLESKQFFDNYSSSSDWSESESEDSDPEQEAQDAQQLKEEASGSENEEEALMQPLKRQSDSFPPVFNELGCREKYCTPQKAANALWLLNKKLGHKEFQQVRQNFSFWANKHKPGLDKQVNEVIYKTYHMR